MVHEAVYFVVHICAFESCVDGLDRSINRIIILTLKLKSSKPILLASPQVHVWLMLAIRNEFRKSDSVWDHLEIVSCVTWSQSSEFIVFEIEVGVFRSCTWPGSTILDNGPLLWRFHEVSKCILFNIDELSVVELLEVNEIRGKWIQREGSIVHSL